MSTAPQAAAPPDVSWDAAAYAAHAGFVPLLGAPVLALLAHGAGKGCRILAFCVTRGCAKPYVL